MRRGEATGPADFSGFPAAPPPPEGEPPAPDGMPRRDFLWKMPLALASGLFVLRNGNIVDQAIGRAEWPPDAIEIIPAYGSEDMPKSGEEWLVFGGFGQKYSTNAAQELFYAIGNEQPVSSIKYANQGFTIDDLAQSLEKHIVERNITSLNIAGVSMGMPIALMTLRRVWERGQAGIGPVKELPTINYLAAYSSPADWHDALDSDMVNVIATLSEKLPSYEPAVAAKLLYSSFDGDGDALRTLNILKPKQFLRQLRNTLHQTFNGTSPQMALAQIILLSQFNLEAEWQALLDAQGGIVPGKTQFAYCSPTNYIDPTVDNVSSIEKYKKRANKSGVTTTVLDTGPVGHANTIGSAIALGEFVFATTTI